ncbi:MAG: GNAT family N-acetyltransferase [Nitrospinota bacterium]
MAEVAATVKIRPLEELDIGSLAKIDEKVSRAYRPEEWERRAIYYIRRDPETSQVAEVDGAVVGFMLGEIRSGEFGLEEPTGWIEVMGIDPAYQGQAIGRKLAEAMFDHFRARGAKSVRTLVSSQSEEIIAFFKALGFTPSPIQPLEKAL